MTICSRSDLSRRRLFGVALGLLATSALPPVMAAPSDPASVFIDRLGKQVVAVLADGAASPSAKVDRLSKLLDDSIDLPVVGRLVLGRYWRDASAQQQQDYLQLFRSLAVKAMADRLGDYAGESFEVTGSRLVDDRDSMVAVKIVRPGGRPPVNVDWRVRAEGGRQSVVDIVAEGVSMVVTQRSEATDIASKRGIDGLLAEMKSRLAGKGA